MMVSIEQHVDWVADCLIAMRARGLDHDRADRDGRGRLECARRTTAPTSRCIPRPTPGTWAPTCRASRGCSCPTSAASTATAAICDEVVEPRLPGLRAHRPDGGRPVQRRRDPCACSPTCGWCSTCWRTWTCRRSSRCRPPEARAFMAAAQRGAPARPGGRRDRRRRRCPAPAALAYRLYRPASARPAPDRRLLPRRRLGAGRAAIRRSVLPRPVRAHRR